MIIQKQNNRARVKAKTYPGTGPAVSGLAVEEGEESMDSSEIALEL